MISTHTHTHWHKQARQCTERHLLAFTTDTIVYCMSYRFHNNIIVPGHTHPDNAKSCKFSASIPNYVANIFFIKPRIDNRLRSRTH